MKPWLSYIYSSCVKLQYERKRSADERVHRLPRRSESRDVVSLSLYADAGADAH